jgi:hypothetical protein
MTKWKVGIKTTISIVYRCNGVVDDEEMRDIIINDPESYRLTVRAAKRFRKMGFISILDIQNLSKKYGYNVWMAHNWEQKTSRQNIKVLYNPQNPAEERKYMSFWEKLFIKISHPK